VDQLIELIVRNLGHYLYPGFRIQICHNGGELDFGGNLYGRFVPTNTPTDLHLDAYHHMLLQHESGHENLAGLASVLYWGFATFGDNYARNRVARLMQGHGNRPAVVPETAAHHLREARISVAREQYGEALGHVGQMSQLSRTPFASKIVAFLCPDRTGVYDNRIANGLDNHPVLRNLTLPGGLFEHCARGIGPVASPTVRQKYQAWCVALCQIAENINDGRQEPRVRALDIERATFEAFAA
jgi:hypothetical protein